MSGVEPTLEQAFDLLATELFGPEWPRPLAAFAGVNPRTAQRIQAAAREGYSHPSTYGALKALVEAAPRLQARLAEADVQAMLAAGDRR